MAGTTRQSDLLEEIVYARVLLCLEVAQLKRRDRALRERLRALLRGLGPGEGRRRCEEALERAWQRVADEARVPAGPASTRCPRPADAPR